MSKTVVAILGAFGLIIMVVGLVFGFQWRLAEEQYKDEYGRNNIRTIDVYYNAQIALTVMLVGGVLESIAALLGYFKKETSNQETTDKTREEK